MRHNRLRDGLISSAIAGLLLAFGVMRAAAGDPVGIEVLELSGRKLKVAILSGPDFDPKSVRKRGLVMSLDEEGGFVKAKRLSGLKDMKGGGGSMARRATVHAELIDENLIYGAPTSDNGYMSMVVVTFQAQPK